VSDLRKGLSFFQSLLPLHGTSQTNANLHNQAQQSSIQIRHKDQAQN
jgi:hypothetical protein